MSAVGFAYGSQLSPARGPVSRGTYQGRASSLYSPAAAGCGRLGRSLLSWASVRARFYHICLSSFTTYMHVFVTCCCFLCERFAPVVAAHCTARSSAAPSAPLFLLSRPPPLLAPLVPSLLSVLPSPPSVWGCCLPWVLSLPAGREFFGVGWCLFHLPHSLWELAWLISSLVSLFSLAARTATARACARLHVLPHALLCTAAAEPLFPLGRRSRALALLRRSRSLVPWRRSRTPVLLRRRSRPHV